MVQTGRPVSEGGGGTVSVSGSHPFVHQELADAPLFGE